jgi:hypothetical protein
VQLTDLPGPSEKAEVWVTSLEPWQRDGLLRLRDRLGVDSDALLRAGITIVLALVATATPDLPDRRATGPSSKQSDSGDDSPESLGEPSGNRPLVHDHTGRVAGGVGCGDD